MVMIILNFRQNVKKKMNIATYQDACPEVNTLSNRVITRNPVQFDTCLALKWREYHVLSVFAISQKCGWLELAF